MGDLAATYLVLESANHLHTTDVGDQPVRPLDPALQHAEGVRVCVGWCCVLG